MIDLEVRSTGCTEVCIDVNTLIHRYLNVKTLPKTVVWLKKFYDSLRGRNVPNEISVAKIERALVALIKYVQRKTFREGNQRTEKKQCFAALSQIKSLNQIPMEGVLRVGGRLENAIGVEKTPIILPNHHLTRLVI